MAVLEERRTLLGQIIPAEKTVAATRRHAPTDAIADRQTRAPVVVTFGVRPKRIDAADDFVAEHHRRSDAASARVCVQIAAAKSATGDAHANIPGAQIRRQEAREFKRLAWPVKQHGA